MSTIESVVYTALRRIRAFLDEPDAEAKFDDAFIMRDVIVGSMVDIMGRLQLTNGVPIINKFVMTLVDGTLRYRLPPCIQQVLRFVIVGDDGVPLIDLKPRSLLDYRGKGWALEGMAGSMELVLEEGTSLDDTVEIWYTNNGDFRPHYSSGTGDGVIIAGGLSMTMDTAPVLGDFDFRENAYAGAVLRVFARTTANVIPRTQEVIIKSSNASADGTAWTAVFHTAIEVENGSTGTDPVYEIVPAGMTAMTDAIVWWSCYKLAIPLGLSETRRNAFLLGYRMAKKTLVDNLTNAQGRSSHHFVKPTVDHPDSPGGWAFFPQA